MKLAFVLGRLFSRTEATLCPGPGHNVLRAPFRPFRHARTTLRTFRSLASSGSRRQAWTVHRATPRTLMAATGGGLAVAAFIELSEKGNNDPEETGEKRMLATSREEIRKPASEDDRALHRLQGRVAHFVDLYIWEPVCTCLRFLQLVAIFVPVILTAPAIWVGSRVPERDNERRGTLWWYGFLVQSMEWAGPAFIKVRTCSLP